MAAAQHPDLRVLLHSLVNPTSNEAYVRDQAALTELFKQPEFFIALQAYAADKSLSQGERLLASVITGRELKTKWRSKALVPEARKPELRERLFTFLEEPDFGVSGTCGKHRWHATTDMATRSPALSSASSPRSRVSSIPDSSPPSPPSSSTPSSPVSPISTPTPIRPRLARRP